MLRAVLLVLQPIPFESHARILPQRWLWRANALRGRNSKRSAAVAAPLQRCVGHQPHGLLEFADVSIPHCYWAKAYYEHQRARGSSRQAALRALAFKWIRIMYRCWQNRTPYDEAKYLTALKRRGSPLVSS